MNIKCLLTATSFKTRPCMSFHFLEEADSLAMNV